LDLLDGWIILDDLKKRERETQPPMSDNKLEELTDWLRVQFTVLQEQEDASAPPIAAPTKAEKIAKQQASSSTPTTKRQAKVLLEQAGSQNTTLHVQEFLFLFAEHSPEHLAQGILQCAAKFARSYQEPTVYIVTVEGVKAAWSVPMPGSRYGTKQGPSPIRAEILPQDAWADRGDRRSPQRGPFSPPDTPNPNESPGAAMVRAHMAGMNGMNGMGGQTTNILPEQSPAAVWMQAMVEDKRILVENQQRLIDAMLSTTEANTKFMQRTIVEQHETIRTQEKTRVQSFGVLEDLHQRKHEREMELAKEKKTQDRTDMIMDQLADKIMPMGMAMLARWIGGKGIPPEVAPVMGMLQSSFSGMTPDRMMAIMQSGLFQEKEVAALLEMFKLMTAITEKQAQEKAAKEGHVNFTPPPGNGEAAE
jgi:hypothetical protein